MILKLHDEYINLKAIEYISSIQLDTYTSDKHVYYYFTLQMNGKTQIKSYVKQEFAEINRNKIINALMAFHNKSMEDK